MIRKNINHNKKNLFFDKEKKLSFQSIPLSREETVLYNKLNNIIPAISETMPESMRAPAILFFLDYSKTEIGRPFEFYKNFHAPSWTIIYHIFRHCRPDMERTHPALGPCILSHAMAMLLHSLDDHLSDGQVSATHLVLLLRSQAWTIMNRALDDICNLSRECLSVRNECINRYYRSITADNTPETLNEYSADFRDRMATWTMTPVLTAMLCGADAGFISGVRQAYQSFGIAWRLLDDLNDLDEDLEKSVPTAVSLLLPEKGRKLWRGFASSGEKTKPLKKKNLAEIMTENSTTGQVLALITGELEKAAELCSGLGLNAMAVQFRTLISPITEVKHHNVR